MRRLIITFQKLDNGSLITVSYQEPIRLEDLKTMLECLANGELAIWEIKYVNMIS